MSLRHVDVTGCTGRSIYRPRGGKRFAAFYSLRSLEAEAEGPVPYFVTCQEEGVKIMTANSIPLMAAAFTLLSVFTLVRAAEYSFRTEPEEYYYSYVDTAQIIPCEAIETRDDGTEQLLDVVIFKNSERINNDRPPDGLLPLVAQRHITGILIIPVSMEDSGSTYQCVLEVNGEVVLSSVQATLYVGDGVPLAPLVNPGQIDETFSTVTVTWGKSPVPASSPLQGYTIIITPLIENASPTEVATMDNDTTIQIFHLTPGREYRIEVFGRNSNGNGTLSGALIARTVTPQVPGPPPQVTGVLERFETSFSINISWTLPVIDDTMMTPIDYSIIYYGMANKEAPLSAFTSVTTLDNTTSLFILSGLTEPGNYTVGVAVVNSAGRSAVQFFENVLEIPSEQATLSAILSPQAVIATGVVATSLLLLLTISVLVLLIIYLRTKTREMSVDLNHPDGSVKSDNSPSSKRKGHSSPKIQPSPLHCNGSSVQLSDYEAEPRRAGSPERLDLDQSTRTVDSFSTSTFIDSSLKEPV